ncbi:MAG TPA: lysine/arginine/ornithine ABC transporter substrate-binding protein [Geminicoccaceae bacterium]|nr:lysine/arginine/ornithine ABC transporter substrate-binding protein [Geminicoccaceae bacterium]
MVRNAAITLVAAAMSLAAGTATAKDWSSVRIATEGAYPPWNWTDSSGQLIGFEIDLANDLCRRMQVECEIVAQDWEGIIPALTAGKYDAIMAGMSITDERKKVISFSDGYAAEPAYFAVLKDSDLASYKTDLEQANLDEVDEQEQAAIDSLKELLDGKSVGVQVATIHANFLEQYMGDAIDIRSYDTQENLDLDLQAGRVDAALASASYWYPLMQTEKGADFTLIGPGFDGGPFGKGVGVGLRQEDTDLAELFNKAIAEAKADGTINRLAQQWFGFDVTS